METLKNRFLSFFVILGTLVFSIEANIGEFDEVWKARAAQAEKIAEECYNPDPHKVANNLNKQVHRYFSHFLNPFATSYTRSFHYVDKIQ